jgi:hypothetical protein
LKAERPTSCFEQLSEREREREAGEADFVEKSVEERGGVGNEKIAEPRPHEGFRVGN